MNHDTLRFLISSAESLSRSCCVGTDVPRLKQQFDLMHRLPARVGDLVLITSVRSGTPEADRIGWLQCVEDVPARPKDIDEEYAPTYRVWTIARLTDGSEIRWENVSVIRLIEEAPEGIRVINRVPRR